MHYTARTLTLTDFQSACLIVLRHGKNTKSKVAIKAKLDLAKTAIALSALTRLGLAKQDHAKRWSVTTRGKTCAYKKVADRLRRNSGAPGPGGRRLLTLLNHPMRGKEIARHLGLTLRRVQQLVIKLHAQGLVTFGDPDRPLWIVMRSEDQTGHLSREEERVLSATPRDYATDLTKVRLAAHMSVHLVERVVDGLIFKGLVEASAGLRGASVFRVTEAGLRHPQRIQSARRALESRLPVESERIRNVLSAIAASEVLRIKEVTDRLKIPPLSMNALMQYLKRKDLVRKTGPELFAPYSLTEAGHAVLAEMTRREAA
jgi:DNA-binding IclR family transcriptional regulator